MRLQTPKRSVLTCLFTVVHCFDFRTTAAVIHQGHRTLVSRSFPKCHFPNVFIPNETSDQLSIFSFSYVSSSRYAAANAIALTRKFNIESFFFIGQNWILIFVGMTLNTKLFVISVTSFEICGNVMMDIQCLIQLQHFSLTDTWDMEPDTPHPTLPSTDTGLTL